MKGPLGPARRGRVAQLGPKAIVGAGLLAMATVGGVG